MQNMGGCGEQEEAGARGGMRVEVGGRKWASGLGDYCGDGRGCCNFYLTNRVRAVMGGEQTWMDLRKRKMGLSRDKKLSHKMKAIKKCS